MTERNHGIDYGLGRSNIDRKTGIRFGVVHTNEMTEWFWDSVDSEYDDFCPACGNELTAEQRDALTWPKSPCPHCEEMISPDDTTGDEPSRNVIDSEGIKATVDEQGDIFILESPFYSRGTFCSPCAPGAVHLGERNGTDDEDAPRAYALPHEWFEKGRANGRVFRVVDDTEVFPESDDTGK